MLALSGGKADVLVIGDHGNSTDGQQLGNDYLTPQLTTGSGSALLDSVAGCVNAGGTLVLTGCQVFSKGNIADWQQYATTHKITIMGSASTTGWSSGSVSGVWITLVPGGTAPTINP